MSALRNWRVAWLVLLACATLIATALGIAETVAWRESLQLGAQVSNQRLHATIAAQKLLEYERTQELELRTNILANNAALVAYVTQALTSGALPGSKIDTASIFDQLLQRKRELGLDLTAILDPQGRLVVAAGRMPTLHGHTAADLLVQQVLASQRSAVGLWLVGGHFEQVALAPLVRGNTIEALLLTGRNVDSEFARSLAGVADTDVALISSTNRTPQIIASTLSSAQSRALIDALRTYPDSSARNADATLLLGAHRVSIGPLFGASQGAEVAILAPPAPTLAIWRALSLPLLMGAALISVLLIAGVLILQYRLLQPLQRLSLLIERAAAGDYELSTNAIRGDALVAYLGVAFDRLMLHVRLRLTSHGGAASASDRPGHTD